MSVHIALLRAINVGGRVVKMAPLREMCEGIGLTGVETFIASGNVIFSSAAKAPALEKKLEALFASRLGFEVATFVRSVPDLTAIVARAGALAKKAGATSVYVGFLKAEPDGVSRTEVRAFANDIESFEFSGREVYWLSTQGVSDSKFSYAVLERILGSPATFRNITTVRKLEAKYAGP
ncbi:MAG: DUF1697 domain-containing protein [Acidobacteriota bacterium]|nr:DUF1697 domain-containing protein [Acidobacteriota bacterium]